MTTALTDSSSRSSRSFFASAAYTSKVSAFSLSGRARVRTPTPSATLHWNGSGAGPDGGRLAEGGGGGGGGIALRARGGPPDGGRGATVYGGADRRLNCRGATVGACPPPTPRPRGSTTPCPPRDGRRPRRPRAARWFSPVRLGRHVEARTRTWVPAMVPWRATEDGFVTPDVLDWYARFARGQPGVLVVEATGIRDVPSGPLLRVGHDRFIEGLARLVERSARASGGETRLFLQIIDFLSIRRRPAPEAFFGRFLGVTDALRGRMARTLTDARWAAASEAGDPRPAAGGDASGSRRDPRRARARGARHRRARARDRRRAAARPRAAARAARALRRCRGARTPRRLRRRRAPLRPRVHDGLVPLADEHAPRRLRLDARGAAAAAARGDRGRARTRGRVRRRRALPRRRGDRGREPTSRTPRAFGVAFARAGLDWLSISKGGQVRGREAARGRRGGLSVHGPERPRVHADRAIGRARPVRAQRAARGRDPGARSAPPDSRRPS